ncbi:MAG TPA: hypothetical protein VEC43_04050 [Candidatus Acidoferrales bacterium]|nr:hypothetical protein [Candidatus Acidoferrales bacterium]
MAIYFLSDGGVVERRDFRCLFCEAVFDERKALSLHYLDVHSPAFSAEELIMAAARHPHEAPDTGRSPSLAD